MTVVRGSLRWGSLTESLDAAALVERIEELLASNKLLRMYDVSVELVISSRVGSGGGICTIAELVVRLRCDRVGVDTRAFAALAERLEMFGLDVEAVRGSEEALEFILRVEARGDCE